MSGLAKVLVTGANGFIGQRLCRDLAAAGLHVRGARRARGGNHPDIARNEVAGVEYAQVGDIDASTDWGELLQGVDAVVHTAARVHVLKETAGDPLAAFRRVNVDGSLALARQAIAAGVRRLVFLSSIGARGPTIPEKPYQRSKREAEQALQALCSDSAMDLLVLRPPLVYGRGAPGNFDRLQRAVARGLPLPLGGTANRRSVLFVGNLSDAVRHGLEQVGSVGGVFELADSETVSTPELARRIGIAMGRPARILWLPAAFLAFALRASGRGATVEPLIASLEVDNRDIESRLGCRPPFSLDEGLEEALAWRRRN